jgi:hypothetical protein
MAVFAYIPYSVYKGYYLLASLQGIDAVFVMTVLWLNHIGQHTLSRYAYLIVVNGFVYINSCFIGYDSHVQDFFYISYIVPFLLFSVRSYRDIVFGVLIAILFSPTYMGVHINISQLTISTMLPNWIYTI